MIGELPEGDSFAQWQWANPTTSVVGTQTNVEVVPENRTVV
ncbi:hypothetical protein ACIRQ6_05475 [Algirhabdus cladophorae]